jgi:hypothetical protein
LGAYATDEFVRRTPNRVSFRGAPLGASPESILAMVVMDSRSSPCGVRNDDGGINEPDRGEAGTKY